MSTKPDNTATSLGSHIPLIYHFAMLQDEQRMLGFREAISIAVQPGARVLELGGGTGVLSYFAAQKASKVFCVEKIPANATAARKFLDSNPNGYKVEVICADAFEYLPPEPVDVVICEMIHVGMLRERQIEMIESFKLRYRQRFGESQPLPCFVPEAFIQAVQPLNYNFDFFGYNAPVPLFQVPGSIAPTCREIGQPLIFQTAQYKDNLPLQISWQGLLSISEDGHFNALRLVLKNILAIVVEENRAVHWLNHYLVLPLKQPLQVSAGDNIQIAFSYNTGCEIEELIDAITVTALNTPNSLSSQVQKDTSSTSPLRSRISGISIPKSLR